MPRWIKIMLSSMGALFIVVGVVVGVFGTRAAQRRVDHLTGLHPISSAEVSASRVGAEAIVAGVLSERNPVVFRDYVAFTREELRVRTDNKGKREETWHSAGRETPRLVVEADGDVVVGNDGYSISVGHELWYDPATLNFSDRPRDGTIRYNGLIAGKPVTIYGTVADGRQGHEIAAQSVFGGTHAEFLASEQSSADMLPILGGIFGVVGLILAGLGVWFFIRF